VLALLARRSLKPQLNQIRTWVRQGRTDAWIAHQLDVSVPDIKGFKREHDLAPDTENGDDAAVDQDLRAEDDALVAAALEAEEEEAPEPEPEAEDDSGGEDSESEGEPSEEDKQKSGSRRRRGRRGGRGRKRKAKPLEGTFDHGEEGYGLWLDPAVQDDPVYAEHWAGHRPIVISVEAERIVITRAGEDGAGNDDDDSS
jgi:hypothetical protein